MSFLHPEFIYYMLPPLFILFALLLTQKEAQGHFFSDEVMSRLRVSANTLTIKARNALFLLMSFFMVIALAEPVIEGAKVEVKAKSADLLIAIDISDSMLAEDVYPNRLDAAKQKALTLLESDINERIGVVAFAKNSYLVSPLSFDSEAVAFLLRQLDTKSITEKGTDFLSVLDIVAQTQKDKKKKYLLLLTDGGDKEDFSDEIELAKENGISVFILGVGTKKGAPIKKDNGSFIKYKGEIIISKLNENIATLATKTGGVYIESTTSDKDIKTMFNEIAKVSNEKELKSEEITKFVPLFYYPVAMALLLLLIATSSIPKRGAKNAALVFALVFLFAKPLHVEAGMLDFVDINDAKEAYAKGDYENSAKLYKEYAQKSGNSEAYYDAANSYYKQKKYKEAIEMYKRAGFTSAEKNAKNRANLGNAYAKSGALKKAIEVYEESLKLKEDKDTKENLEMVKKLLKEQEKKQNQQNKQNKNKDKKQKNKDNKKSKDKKQGDKKDSDEKQKKDSSDKNKDKNKNEKNSSKSKDSKDKQEDKKDMKSKKEQQKENEHKGKKKDKNQKKDKLKKLDADKKKNDKKCSSPQRANPDKMSDAEEKKWLKHLNSKSNTYLYRLNNNDKNKRRDEDEKPW
jgi:Ca-activated chloride channel family protein